METATDSPMSGRGSRGLCGPLVVVGHLKVTPRRRRRRCLLRTDVSLSIVALLLQPMFHLILLPSTLLLISLAAADQPPPAASTSSSSSSPIDSPPIQIPDHIKRSENYEIVIPKRVNENGIAFPKDRHYLRRHKRETVSAAAEDGVSIIYKLTAFGRDIDIRLSPDETIVADGLRVQHMADNETWLGADLSKDSTHCFHSGSVDQDPLSVAILSTCESLLGIIHSFEERYFIEPLCSVGDNADSCSSTDGLAHVIYKWTPPENTAHFDFTGYMNEEDLELGSESGLRNEVFPPRPTTPPRRRKRRYLSQQRFVEVMVVADDEMKRFHGADLENYLLTLMAIVSRIYRDYSIGNPIKIVVVKVVVLETELAGKMVSKNAATTLRGFCDWQKQVNVANDNDPGHHDTAVLLTKHDICRSNQKCDTLGLAELGTMCDSHRSCSIVKDSGLSAAFTIAHELGHVFSLRHDDECYQFKNQSDLYHIMAPTLDHETKYWSWSECSRNKMTEFLSAGHADCLNDKPPTSLKPFPVLTDDPGGTLKLPGNVYTVDQQCAHTFEPNSVRCPYLPVCVRLWCTNPDAERVGCSTKHMPWADGTPCSSSGANESMWCIRGHCVLKRIIRPRDGQWGPWAQYGQCSRTCGGGIQQSTRPCNNPEPDNGGKYCTGRRIKYKSCNHKDCPEGSVDFREQQCSSYNRRHFNINGLTPDVKWVAKYSGIEAKDRCKLFCRVSTNAAYYQLADRVADGTKCGLDTTDICVMGLCRKAGCDNRLGSSMARDKCGICGGDNSNCQQINEQFPDGVKIAYGYNHVTRIPKGSTNIDIRQYSPVNTKDDDTYLALKNSSGKFVLNGDFIVSAFHKELNVHGSILEYTGSGSTVERITGTGALLDDIEVYVLTVGELLYKPNIMCQYTVRINASKPYIWSKTTMDWTKCSHLCQGKKVRKVVCLSINTGAVVSDQHCLEIGKKPSDSVKSCHGRCRLSWKVVGEGECSAKCNEKGFIQQDIRCQKELLDSSRSDLNMTTTLVAAKHCRHIANRPIDCIGPCHSTRWAYTSWSECSRSCGGGEQRRSAYCMNELGQRLAEDACRMERKVTEQRCNKDSCPHWVPKKWTGCSVTCGSGMQFREVDCVQGQNTTVKTRCSSVSEPERRRECNAGICPSWDLGKWGQCSATCGKGIQQRVVKCRSAAATIIDDSACDASSRPRTDATCRIATCTTVITTTLATTLQKRVHEMTPVTLWRTGGWTECSASCGSGSRQRYVSCRDLEGNIALDSFCEHLLKPDYIEPCSIRPCGQWRTGDWTHCSATCGEGRETRLVACMSLEELEEQMRSQLECDVAIKPPTERICNRRDCLQDKQLSIFAISSNNVVGTTFWRAGPWGPCSSTCEDGLKRRRVICQDERGSSDNCDPDIQPPEQTSCNMGPCPYWNHGEWGQCDVTCGGGSQQRIVSCQLPSGVSLPDANCLDFAPPRKQPCALSACPPPTRPSRTRWQKGRWSSCSVSCGKGLKQRPVVCIDDAGKEVTDHLCKVQKPKVTTWCRKGRCPFWWSSPWSQCSVSCDAGVRRRTVLCMRGHNRTVDSSRCQHFAEPVNTSPCSVRKCQQFYWVTGNWSECSHPCSFGSQMRNVSCVEMTSGREVEQSFCVETDKPNSEKDCSMVPCSNIWITSDWTRCSASCGKGLQRRAVSCRAMAREGWLLPGHVGLHACNQLERPSSEKECSYGDCSSLYHWETTSWSQCSKTCGFGRAYRESYCFNSSGMKHTPNDCEASLRPSIERPCYMGPCYSTSCRDVKQHTAWKADGEFNLLVEGRLVPIYCREMTRSHPKEYLTLVADENENYSEIYDKRLAKANTCPENGTRIHHCQKCFRSNLLTAGRTKFSKVRLNITSLHVIGNDFTFSSTTGKKRIPFATGGDCYSRTGNCAQGKFQVILSGTRFRVASNSEWQTFGYKTSKHIDISMDRQIVRGRCGGHCGRCSPNDGLLKLELVP